MEGRAYRYSGRNDFGDSLRGTVVAASEAQARLEAAKLGVVEVRVEPEAVAPAAPPGFSTGILFLPRSQLYRCLVGEVAAGRSLDAALERGAERTHGRLQRRLRLAAEELREGGAPDGAFEILGATRREGEFVKRVGAEAALRVLALRSPAQGFIWASNILVFAGLEIVKGHAWIAAGMAGLSLLTVLPYLPGLRPFDRLLPTIQTDDFEGTSRAVRRAEVRTMIPNLFAATGWIVLSLLSARMAIEKRRERFDTPYTPPPKAKSASRP